MFYTKDEKNKDIIIDKTGFQVMMEWEKPYMKALIDRLQPTGDVLEIGFGLGYSSNYIQTHNIKSHTIIESDTEVLKNLKNWSVKQKHKVNIIEGSWQNELNKIGKFDSVFFDDSPHIDHKDDGNIRLYDFYYRILKKHVNIDCKLTWYCDNPIYWLAHSATEWSNRKFIIDIPDNCNYIDSWQKNKKEVYLPLVKFPFGCVENIIPIVFDKFLNFYKLNEQTL
jgi:SAM-dependent methyltransferase